MRRLTQPRVSCYYSPRRSPGPPPSPRVPLLSTARAKVPSFRASARGPRGPILTPVCSSDGPGPDFDYCFSGSHALSSVAKDRIMTDRGGSSGTPGARRALSVSLLAKVDGRRLARVARNREQRIDPDDRSFGWLFRSRPRRRDLNRRGIRRMSLAVSVRHARVVRTDSPLLERSAPFPPHAGCVGGRYVAVCSLIGCCSLLLARVGICSLSRLAIKRNTSQSPSLRANSASILLVTLAAFLSRRSRDRWIARPRHPVYRAGANATRERSLALP